MSSNDFLPHKLDELADEDIDFYFMDNLLSTLIGLAVGVVIGYILFKKYTYHGPNSKDIVNKTYYDKEGKPYRLEPVVVICPSELSMNKLHDKNFKAK